jgi:dTDP-4-amino-4,6-dideoxygalactose transaminase
MSASQLALLGGEAIGAPPADRHPNFREETLDRVLEVMRAGGTVGLNKTTPAIGEAERAIAEWQGMPHCLVASSGHAALHNCLIGLEVSWGDEVIATPFTWGASISCVLHNNAVPVFVDVCPETGLMDPAQIEAAITSRTKAILPVHIFGQAADMTAIREIADQRGLVVIEDGSQAHGSIHAGCKVGTFGDAAGFSCMGGKLLATAEAGYMLTSHADVYWKAALCTQHMGRSPEPDFPRERFGPYVDSLVHTYRLSPLVATMLAEQVKKIDGENAGRRESVRLFREAMAGARSVRFPTYPKGDDPVYHMLTMNFDAEFAGVSKQTFFQALQAEGVGCFQYIPSPIPTWPRLHWQTYDGPKIMWTEPLRQSGIDYREVSVPNCERKIAQSVEVGWNYIEPSPAKMQQLASAFLKVEANLPALREWETR